MSWVCIIQMNRKFGLMAMKDESGWGVHGFDDQRQGLSFFEEGYARAHARGCEGSMSACLNWLFFHPSIVDAKISELEGMVLERTVLTSRNVAGSMTYIPLDPAKASPVWEAGAKPELIKGAR